ncbi:MAG TPA: glycosyltransferase family 2 protein [Xanthobacteraceae bacterium]|nr:glycosyltransferase family 2 protein [Xanthobacteraceae bacterium]
MRVAIVIPAFNEADSIGSVVERVKPYGMPIVVDDGSTDETGRCAAEAGATVMRQRSNNGYDAALARGFAEAEQGGADVIVTTDADGQLDTACIPAMLQQFAELKIALVLGVRPAAARWSEALFNRYARLRFGVSDILCGMKAFRVEAYCAHREKMAEPSVFTALALALLRNGASFASVPVSVHARTGRSRFGGAWRGNIRILRALGSALADDLVRR